MLTAPMEVIKEHAKAIIDEGIQEPGYIFNLGHGLFPEASLEKLRELTEYVHDYSAEVNAGLKREGGAYMTNQPVGVLVMSYGTPESMEGIEDVLHAYPAGDPPTPEQLD